MIVLQPHWARPVLSPQHPPPALCPEAQPLLQARRWGGCVLTAPSHGNGGALPAGGSVAFSPGNLSTSSSASSTLGSPENEEYILSFETIDKMRRVSSYSSLNSLIGESHLPLSTGPLGTPGFPPRWAVLGHAQWEEGVRLAVAAGTSPLDAGLTQAVQGASLVLGQATGLPRLQSRMVLPSGDILGVMARAGGAPSI